LLFFFFESLKVIDCERFFVILILVSIFDGDGDTLV